MMRRLLIIFLLLAPFFAISQHIGTEFRVAFLRNGGANFGSTANTQFSIYAIEDADITVTFAAPGFPQFQQQSITVAAGEVGVVSFPLAYLNQEVFGVAQQRSFRISSTAPVRVLAYQFNNGTSEGTPVLPVSSLGTEYVVVNYRSPFGGLPTSIFSIVAVQDNTVLSIELSEDTQLGAQGSIVNVTLDAGEVLSLSSVQNVIGTRISSSNDVPFAAFAGGEASTFPIGCLGLGQVYEQMLPTNLWGKVHPLITAEEVGFEGIVIASTVPETTFEFGCNSSFTLESTVDVGSFKSNFGLLISSEPVSVGLITPVATCNLQNRGTTNMRLIEPLSRGNTAFAFRAATDFPLGYDPNISFNVLHLALPNADTANVLVNNLAVTDWIPSNSNPVFYAARVELGPIDGLTTITSSTPVWANYLALQANDAITMSLGSGAVNDLPEVENLYVNLPDSAVLCQGETVELDPGLMTAGTWQDGSVQTTFTASEPGVYYVSYDAMCPNSRDTVVVELSPVALSLPEVVEACPGETVSLAPDSTEAGYTYQWAGQEVSPVLQTATPGVYTLTATNSDGCSLSGQTNYIPFPLPAIELPTEVQLCPNDSLVLSASGNGSWLWNTGDTLSSIHVTQSGVYTVSLVDSLGCIASRSTSVVDEVLPLLFPEVFLVCEGETDEVEVLSPNGEVLWINPPVDNPATLGEGFWEIQASNLCGITSAGIEVRRKDCNCEAAIPNIFTPNGDGRNDAFVPQLQCESTHYQLNILNRWGTEIFETFDPLSGWDGTLADGSEAPDGVYYYLLGYRNDLRKDRALLAYSGVLTLTR